MGQKTKGSLRVRRIQQVETGSCHPSSGPYEAGEIFLFWDFFSMKSFFAQFLSKIAKKRCQRNGFFLIWSHILMSQEGLNA